MKETDYIIVGLGIAGLAFCEQLERNHKKFIVFDTGVNTSTKVSGGVFNPVVLKRFTLAWMAKEHMEASLPFYKNLSKKLGTNIFCEIPVLRILSSIEEQNDWVVASDKLELAPFLSSTILKNDNQNINAPFGFGRVNTTGRIFPSLLLTAYRQYLQKKELLISEAFHYDQLSEENNKIVYKGISSKKIVFAEGAAVVHNPFFPKLRPTDKKRFFIGNKGEFIIIKAPQLKVKVLVKGPVYIIPLGDHFYKIGATYTREDDTYETTIEAKYEIIRKVRKMIFCDFEVIAQEAGMRPTTKDRRPMLGSLPIRPNMIFFNGLGTHGIMSAPFLSEMLYNHLEENMQLPEAMEIKRWCE